MKDKIKHLIKGNIAFVIICLICLIFYIISLVGDYQTTIHNFQVDHYSFLNGAAKSSIIFVIAPIIFIVGSVVLRFFVPKDRMKAIATIVAAFYIAIAIAACVSLLLLFIVIPDQSAPNFTQLGDAYNNALDVYYSKVFNFQYFSMVISLVACIILGCYGAATCSE